MKTILTLQLPLVLLFLCLCQGECPIECYCDLVTTCTGDKLLSRFPQSHTYLMDLFPFRLELHDFNVRLLSSRDFLKLIPSNLSELSLAKNSLEEIDNETFTLSTSTTATGGSSASASSNSRQSPSTTTFGSSSSIGDHRSMSTRELYSTAARIVVELDGVFKLKILDLSQNKLTHFVGGGRLANLRILDLSSNKLQQVYQLGTLEALESVNLRDNLILYLEPTLFQNLRHLQYLNLDSNSLRTIHPSTFSNLPTLGHLILSSNPISNLLPGFYWNSRVQFVDVSHVGLTSVPTSLTKTVRDFRCANNNLTIIHQTDFESYPNVGLLVLDENRIATVEEDAFGRLDFLTRLWMNGNRLTQIPQSLPPSLQSLHLEDNQIANLSASDFKSLHNLQELNLHGNRIVSIQGSIFGELTSLKSLDLRYNLIDVIYRDSFLNLSKLETLDVSQNPIKVIVTGSFASLGHLSLLHLSRLSEPIEFDTSSFTSSLQKLQILEVDSSPHLAQKLLNSPSLPLLANLIELNLQRCEFEDLNLVSNAISELNLQVVKISGNPWDCQDLLGSAIHELMKRRMVVDDPACDHPKAFRGVPLSTINSSALETLTTTPVSQLILDIEDNIEEEGGPLDFAELESTGEQEQEGDNYRNFTSSTSDSSALDPENKVTNAPNTNSPENLPHASPDPVSTDGTGNRNQSLAILKSGLGSKNPPSSGTSSSNSTTNTTIIPNTSSSTNNSIAEHTAQSSVGRVISLAQSKQTSASAKDTKDPKQSNKKAVRVKELRPSNKAQEVDAVRLSSSDIPSKSPKGNNGSSESDIIDRTIDSNSNSSISSNGSIDLYSETLPTSSYFDYSWRSNGISSAKGTSSISSGSSEATGYSGSGSGNNSSSIGGSGRGWSDKKQAISIPIERLRTEFRDKTKTNDDNTIIDESRRRGLESAATSSKAKAGASRMDDGEETGPRSIDGFPSGRFSDEDKVTTKDKTLLGSGRDKKPEAFYLRVEDPQRSSREQSAVAKSGQTTSGAIIVKTLIISAATCLGSILLLLSLSFGIYYLAKTRTGIFPCTTLNHNNAEEDGVGGTCGSGTSATSAARMSYTRFGKKSRKQRSPHVTKNCHNHNKENPLRHHTQLTEQGLDSDSDQVELSGISNRLYMENEEIYHIT